jgi:hypothetical protein
MRNLFLISTSTVIACAFLLADRTNTSALTLQGFFSSLLEGNGSGRNNRPAHYGWTMPGGDILLHSGLRPVAVLYQPGSAIYS